MQKINELQNFQKFSYTFTSHRSPQSSNTPLGTSASVEMSELPVSSVQALQPCCCTALYNQDLKSFLLEPEIEAQ